MTQEPDDQLTLQKFSALVGTKFRVHLAAARQIELELAEAAPGPGGNPAGKTGSWPRQENFSLIFIGPLDLPLPQRIYRFEHDQMGAFDVFIVPIAREAQAMKYQAVFNRLVRSG